MWLYSTVVRRSSSGAKLARLKSVLWQSKMWFTEGILFMFDMDEDPPLTFTESMSWVILGTRGLSKHWSWLTMLLRGWLLRGLGVLRQWKALEWYTFESLQAWKMLFCSLCEGQSHHPKILGLHSFPLKLSRCHSTVFHQHGKSEEESIFTSAASLLPWASALSSFRSYTFQ